VITSRVLELDLRRGRARTRRTEYRLGSPSRLFTRWARERGHALADYPRAPAPAADSSV